MGTSGELAQQHTCGVISCQTTALHQTRPQRSKPERLCPALSHPKGKKKHLLGFQSQGDDASHHGGRHGGAGVAVGAAVPEVRGDLGREELQPRGARGAPGTDPKAPGLLTVRLTGS